MITSGTSIGTIFQRENFFNKNSGELESWRVGELESLESWRVGELCGELESWRECVESYCMVCIIIISCCTILLR